MFKLRREQMEAFRPLVQAQTEVRLARALEKTGAAVERRPGRLTVRDHKGGTNQLFFRSDGLVAGLKSPQGTLYNFEYDTESRLARIGYPNGDRLDITYDGKSRLQRFTRNGLATHEFKYDSEGRIVSVTYPDGSISRRSYHPEGRLDSFWDRTEAQTRYERNDAGELLAIIDPLERSTLYVRGADGGFSSIQFPDGTRESFDYQGEDRRVTVRHPGGLESETCFSPKGKIQSFRRGADTYEFDDKGHLIKATNSEGIVEMAFDGHDRLVREVTPTGCVEYGYDDDGRLTSISHDSRGRVEFSYDEDYRLACVRDWDRRETAFSYEPTSNTVKLRHANGLQERRTFTSFGRLIEASVDDERGRSIARQAYGYDVCERLAKALDSWGPRPDQNRERSFDYDREGRLVCESDTNSRRTISSFTYDAKGNLVQDNGAPIAIGAMDEPTRHGRANIDYALDGAMLNPPSPGTGARRCEYGPGRLLQAVTVGTRRISFGYDALGRRLWKREGERITRYGWAGTNLIWEQIQNGSGQETWRDYLYLPGSFATLGFRQEGRFFWCESDARGAVCRVFDEQRNVAWRASYEPFGKAEVAMASVKQPWRLLGHYEDEETGLYYNLCRYYCPYTKSYLSRDPSWYKPFAQNYGYARNSPWNYVDPLGAYAGVMAAPAVAGPAAAPLSGIVVFEAGAGAAVVEAGAGAAVVEAGAGAAVLEGGGAIALGSNPVGWVILAVIGIAVIGTAIYISSQSAQPQVCTSCSVGAEEEAPAVPMPDGGSSGPPKDKCKRAIKILEQYERLAKKYGKNLPDKRIKELDALRNAGKITSNHLPGGLLNEFPGEFLGMTLEAIKKFCGMK